MTNKLSNMPDKNSTNFFNPFKESVRHIFKSVHQSMRRKITFDYLMVYVVISLISVIGIPLVFMIFEVQEDVNHSRESFNQVIVNHDRGIYNDAQLNYKVEQLAIEDNSAYEVTVYNKELEESNTFMSEDYEGVKIDTGIFSIIEMLRTEGVIHSVVESGVFGEEQGLRYSVHALYPLRNYRFSIFIIAFTVIVFNSVGFLLMSLIGGNRVKQVLNPIYYMTKTAEQISISDLGKRLDVENTKYELKDLAMTINEMLDRLDQDYTKQKRFVSDVSHELRTPISIINGYASMLERWGKTDEEILEESIDAIIGESKNMQVLVENLLTLVRSDNQTLKYDFSEFDMSKMVNDITKEFNMVNTKNQYITCEVEEGINVVLDMAKVKQTLRIFVDNAVKYTPNDGGVHIKIYKNEKLVYVHVKDSGIGIAKNDLPHLFERFYRSDESRTRQTGGHGLGLAIAKVIIIGHGGKIRVKSKIGKGSEFILSLPLNGDVSVS